MNAVSTVRQLYLVGERRWPRVKLSFEAFESHCRRVFGPEEGVAVEREAADLYLCCACIEADAEALRTFEREGLEVARAAIARIRRDGDFVQEVLQEVWDKLLVGPRAKVGQYSGRGPLKGWIRVAATRVALDRCRSSGVRALREVELTEQLAAHVPNPEAFLTKARFGPAFQEAIRRAVGALAAQDRNVLRMHVTGGCSIDEIGRAYRVHRATAARWLDRSRVAIYDAVRRELCAQHSKLTESEFKSLANLLGSQLQLHLSGLSQQADVQSAHG
ncbi:MAG: sigma factor-like helix-turn-helix DNA-binding protein [Myxococcales bacterium]|jgi:RNA polymerase sigma-70 factor (ECF subfamily)